MTTMKHKFFILFISAFILTNFFSPFSSASAQSVLTLGEIQTSGSVFIESSYGKWLPSAKTYPLLQGTKIKTEEGSASIHFSNGSRVDLSKNTMAVIEGSPSDYSVRLVSGVIAFNINPASSLTVSTASTDVYVNSRKGLVQKVSQESAGWSLGAVSVTDKGTEVKSISGKIFVSVSASDMKLVAPGETLFVGSDGKHKTYAVQAVTGAGAMAGYSSGEQLAAIIIGTSEAVTVGALSGWVVFRGNRHASPSSP